MAMHDFLTPNQWERNLSLDLVLDLFRVITVVSGEKLYAAYSNPLITSW